MDQVQLVRLPHCPFDAVPCCQLPAVRLTRPRHRHQTQRSTGPSPPCSPVVISTASQDSNGLDVNPDTTIPSLTVSPGATDIINAVNLISVQDSQSNEVASVSDFGKFTGMSQAALVGRGWDGFPAHTRTLRARCRAAAALLTYPLSAHHLVYQLRSHRSLLLPPLCRAGRGVGVTGKISGE